MNYRRKFRKGGEEAWRGKQREKEEEEEEEERQ